MQTTDAIHHDGFDPPIEPRKFDWAMACISLVAFFSFIFWFGVLTQLAFYVPSSRRLFDDFKMRTPLATDLVLHHWWWLIPGLIVASVAVCLATRSRWAWFFFLIVLPLALNVLIFVSMFWPTHLLLEGLRR